jgi:hypothetical protein
MSAQPEDKVAVEQKPPFIQALITCNWRTLWQNIAVLPETVLHRGVQALDWYTSGVTIAVFPETALHRGWFLCQVTQSCGYPAFSNMSQTPDSCLA